MKSAFAWPMRWPAIRCGRNVRFDILSVPRTRRGGNWTVTLQSVEPRAVWEASEIVADIQDAYDLALAA